MSYLGATQDQAWVYAVHETYATGWTLVFDLNTHCATESYRTPDHLQRFAPRGELLHNSPDARAGLRTMMGLAARFGLHRLDENVGDAVWTDDSRHVFVQSETALYRSDDTGASFVLADDHVLGTMHERSRIDLTPDQRALVYVRCAAAGASCRAQYELVTLPVSGDPITSLRPVAAPKRYLGLTPTGQALLDSPEQGSGCLTTLDLANPANAKTLCPPADAVIPAYAWNVISPSGRYRGARREVRGVAQDVLYDLQERKLVGTFPRLELRTIDEHANVLLRDNPEDRSEWTFFATKNKAARRVARATLLGIDTVGRRLLLDTSYSEHFSLEMLDQGLPLATHACKLLKTAPMPF